MRITPTFAASVVSLSALLVTLPSAIAAPADGGFRESLAPAAEIQQPERMSPDPQAQAVDPQSFPDVVARVGGQDITKADLLERAQSVRAQLGIQDQTSEFYRKVVEDLVGSELLHQASLAKGFAASEEEVTKEMEALRARFPDEEQFSKQLSSEGLTREKLRRLMTRDMTIGKYVDAEIAPRATVTQDEMKKFYDQNIERMKKPEQARLSHILVKVDAGSSAGERQQAKQKAQDLHQRIKAGEDFAEIARQSSDDPASKAKGGDLDWVSRGQTAPAFEQAAFALQPGQMSEPIETELGYHIIKLADRKPAETIPFDEVKERIGEFLQDQHLQEEVRAEVETLRSKAKVEIFI